MNQWNPLNKTLFNNVDPSSKKSMSEGKDCKDNTSYSIINIVKNYYPNFILNYSDWIDCIFLSKYYYFIQNLGQNDVVIYIEISPDKKKTFIDSDKIIVKSKEVSYLQPLRDSRYIRFSYKNLNSTGLGLITAFFQGKR